MDRVEKYYNQFPANESTRLTNGAYYSIESEITKKFILKYLKQNSKIADVGGGPGHYATWLLRNGHEVHLIDLSDSLLNLAKITVEQERLEKNLLGITKLDARSLLGVPAENFDVTLLMGPLYHLLEANDRMLALKEALRITKPGGYVFSAIINRLCPFMAMMHQVPDKLAHALEHDSEEIDRIIKTGKYEGSDGSPIKFTDAYFADLDEVPHAYSELGVELVETFACEGLASHLYEKAEQLKQSSKVWMRFIDLIFENATRREFLGSSEHVVFIGRKKS